MFIKERILDQNYRSTLWVVGDSTVSGFNDKYYMPRVGWGEGLKLFFKDDLRIINLAISGTSSKSFRKTDNYRSFIEGIAEGDFLIIGFGHNDEKRGDSTFTSAIGDKDSEGSFEHSLYRYYIKPANDKGASCILVTPIARRDKNLIYKNDFVHITPDGDYPRAIRQLGQELSIPVCDLTKQTVDIALKVDAGDDPDNNTLMMHARTGSRPICVDDTHTSMFGAAVNAYLIAQDIRKSAPSLALYLKDEYDDPLEQASYWVSKSINKDYKDPVYIRPDKGSDYWNAAFDENKNVWYPTVFGDISGHGPKSDDFSFDQKDGSLYISAGNHGNNGKISSKSDGIAMYYIRIPVSKSFKLSADIKIESFNESGGPSDFAAYGLMVRDDIYVDSAIGELLGDYVCAGVMFNPSYPKGTNTFARKSGELDFEGGELIAEPKLHDVRHMTIESTRDGYKASIEGYDAVSAGYDYTLTAVDPEYVYVGIFASRAVAISAGNISLEIDGQISSGYDCYESSVR